MADHFFGITDTGKKRSNNEDCFIVENLPGSSRVLACVIDGVGGYEGGELASAIAQETIQKQINTGVTDPVNALKQALITANEKIFVEKNNSHEHNKMACVVTLVIADPEKNKFYYAHVGDTRLYLLRDKTLVKITRDHSAVGYLEESGRLTEEAAMRHPRRNEISKALGFQQIIDAQSDFIETSESPFLPGDTLMLCSDGLTDMINNEAISAILNSDATLEQKGSQLVNAANVAGGNDNITLVMVQNNNKPKLQKATRPQQKNEKQDEVSLSSPTSATSDTKVVSTKKRNGLIPFLIFLVCCLAGISGWLWYERNKLLIPVESPKKAVEKNEAERLFAEMVNRNPSDTNQMVTYTGTNKIVLTHAIMFNHDSVMLNLNNTQFIADSTYKGPAFIFNPLCRYISINNASFMNFETGMQLSGQEILFKNVSFPNTRLAVQQNIMLSDSIIIGSIPAVLLFRNDSLSTHP